MSRAAVIKLQIARRDLRIEDGAYRALLQRLTGQTSSTACTDAQLGRVLDELKGKGWTGSKPAARSGGSVASTRRAATSPMARKARAMWISLHQLGAVRDPSEGALETFGRRQLGVDRLQWADEGQAYRLIEALKAMAERAGWSQDLSGVPAARHVGVLKARLQARLAEIEATR